MVCMPRRLRLQYSGAIYHLMARGNGRQDIVRDDVDRQRLHEQLGKAAVRCSWRVYAFAIMSNHLHVVLKTPEPNLSRGMQSFLSGYANAWSRRHRFSGPCFSGSLSDRVGGRRELPLDGDPLRPPQPGPSRIVEHPAAWAWSSYPGYAHRRRRLEWVAYDELLASWGGAFGGSDSAGAYRQYVTAGLSDPPESPWKEAYHGWILGSGAFVERVRAMVRGEPRRERRRESRLLQSLPLSRVIEVVCASYTIDRSEMSRRGSRHPARAALVYLARSRTMATNTELAGLLGLSRAESVPNLTQRFAGWLATDAKLRRQLRNLEGQLDQLDHPK